jgi:hypothetical protein
MTEQTKTPLRRTINKPIKYFSVFEASKVVEYEDKELFRKVMEAIFLKGKEILLKRFQVRFTGLGLFIIQGYKTDKRRVDYGATKKCGQLVYYTNFHTGRHKFFVKWKHNIYLMRYKFQAYRFLNRDLAKLLKEDE